MRAFCEDKISTRLQKIMSEIAQWTKHTFTKNYGWTYSWQSQRHNWNSYWAKDDTNPDMESSASFAFFLNHKLNWPTINVEYHWSSRLITDTFQSYYYKICLSILFIMSSFSRPSSATDDLHDLLRGISVSTPSASSAPSSGDHGEYSLFTGGSGQWSKHWFYFFICSFRFSQTFTYSVHQQRQCPSFLLWFYWLRKGYFLSEV